MPAVERYGFGFLVGRVWDPNTERYGILAEIWGTLYTSLLALVIGTAFGVAAAIFLSEGFLGQATFRVLRRLGLHLRPRCRLLLQVLREGLRARELPRKADASEQRLRLLGVKMPDRDLHMYDPRA